MKEEAGAIKDLSTRLSSLQDALKSASAAVQTVQAQLDERSQALAVGSQYAQ
jgi:hypothetical protein